MERTAATGSYSKPRASGPCRWARDPAQVHRSLSILVAFPNA